MNPRFRSTLLRELALCLALAAPMLLYVLALNRTAAQGLILLHAALLIVTIPLSVASIESGTPLRGAASRLLGLLLATALMVAALRLLTPVPLGALLGLPLLAALLPSYLAYAALSLALAWLRLREQAARAEIVALAARLHPHFLFNALNGIEELTLSRPETARVAIGRLARLMRSLLDASSRTRVPLGDELRRVEDYLALEQLRFGERFTYRIDMPPDLAALELPPTLLLTLAENAVKHGIEKVRGPVQLQLTALREGRTLRIVLAGSAPPALAGPKAGAGYGLTDIQARLRLAYRDRARLTLVTEETESHVTLQLPL